MKGGVANTLRPGWTSVWLTSHFQAQIYGRGSPLAPGRESRTSGCRGIWDSRHVASGEVSRVTVSMRLERREHTGAGEGGTRHTHLSPLGAGREGGGTQKRKKEKKKKILAAESETCSHLSSGVNPESLHYNQSISSGPALA